MKDNKLNKIENLFFYFISSIYPSREEFRHAINRQDINLVYGETYDTHGITVDSLKYYLFISLLTQMLNDIGIKAKAFVIVGDVASVRNKLTKDKEKLLNEARGNLKIINNIKEKYDLVIEPKLMSELFEEKDFKNTLSHAKELLEKSTQAKELAKSTVMKNRLSHEKEMCFLYTAEEISLIVGNDIKIGPMREINYDKIARMLAVNLDINPVIGVYLNPTYPLNMDLDYFVQHPEIEKYGLTPYKAGSNRLQKHRILLKDMGKTNFEKLMESSFCPKNPRLPNAVYDLYTIGLLAKTAMTKDISALENPKNTEIPKELKAKTTELLEEYIVKPLEGLYENQ